MRLQRRPELAVIIEIQPGAVAEAERGWCTGIGAVSAFTDALHRDALVAETNSVAHPSLPKRRIIPESVSQTGCRLVSKPLQEIAAEICQGRAGG